MWCEEVLRADFEYLDIDIFNHSDIVSFIGAFVVGILGNLYSRIFRGTGFVVMVPGVLFLVPVSACR